MGIAKAVAYARQLCYLGLPPESLGPAVLEALHAVVPTLHNRFAWCDARGVSTALYCEEPAMYACARVFFEQYDNRLPDFPGSRFMFSRRPGVGHYLPIVTQSDYFRGIYHPDRSDATGGRCGGTCRRRPGVTARRAWSASGWPARSPAPA